MIAIGIGDHEVTHAIRFVHRGKLHDGTLGFDIGEIGIHFIAENKHGATANGFEVRLVGIEVDLDRAEFYASIEPETKILGETEHFGVLAQGDFEISDLEAGGGGMWGHRCGVKII